MGGTPEAERALFAESLPSVETIQDFVAQKQHADVRRAFHNRGVPVSVTFEVSPELPAALQVGFLVPGATYHGFGRFSRSQSFHGTDGELDQRGFAFRLETPGRSQDLLFSNTPTSFARDPVMFLRVATIFTKHSRAVVPFKLFRAIGIRDGIAVLRNLLQAPDRKVAFTGQRFWSRTPFEIGDAACRFMVRPLSEARRVSDAEGPEFLALDLRRDLREHARSFELCAQMFVDETVTPIEDASHEWREADAPPIVVGTVTLPQQDLDGADGRVLADRIERSEAFNPWNTPCLRPLGRSNRARRGAYDRSARKRGATVP